MLNHFGFNAESFWVRDSREWVLWMAYVSGRVQSGSYKCNYYAFIDRDVGGTSQTKKKKQNQNQPKPTFFAAREEFVNVIYCSLVLCKYSHALEVCRKLVCLEVLATLHNFQLLNHIWACIHVDLLLFL